MKLDILFRDEHFVAVHKPAGMLVHRTALDAYATRFVLQSLRQQLGCRVYTVHRLDKGTSGVMLFALSPDFAKALRDLFQAREIRKTYLAVVRGYPPEFGEIDHPLRPDPEERRMRPELAADSAQAALTHFRRLAIVELPVQVDRYPSSRYALVELNPVTGRKHQLRRHLKHLSYPIIGDATYGKGPHNRMFQTRFDSQRLLLASVELGFTHPANGESLIVSAPLADDFADVVARLGWRSYVPERWWPAASAERVENAARARALRSTPSGFALSVSLGFSGENLGDLEHRNDGNGAAACDQ